MYDVQMADKGTTNMLEPYSDGSVTLRGSFRWCSLQQPVSLRHKLFYLDSWFITTLAKLSVHPLYQHIVLCRRVA